MWLFAELLLYISNLMSVKCNADDNMATYLYRLLPHYYGMSRACFLFCSTCLYMTFNYLQSCNIRDIFECRWDRIKCYEPLLMIYGYGLAGFTHFQWFHDMLSEGMFLNCNAFQSRDLLEHLHKVTHILRLGQPDLYDRKNWNKALSLMRDEVIFSFHPFPFQFSPSDHHCDLFCAVVELVTPHS